MTRTQTASDAPSNRYFNIDDMSDLFAAAKQAPEVHRERTHSKNPNTGEMELVSQRDTLWTNDENPRVAGNVTSNQDWYHVAQYSEVLRTIGDALIDHDKYVEPSGYVNISETASRMTGVIELGRTIEVQDGDEIELELHFSAGHSGSRAIEFTVGATRLICQNGMTAFDTEATYRQTHSKPFDRSNVFDAISHILEGDFEERLQAATEATLRSREEALFTIFDTFQNEDDLFDNPLEAINNGLDAEVASSEPSLYETYQAATYAVTHEARDDAPDYIVNRALKNAAALLDQRHRNPNADSALPDPEEVGSDAVINRLNDFQYGTDAEERFEGERDALAQLA